MKKVLLIIAIIVIIIIGVVYFYDSGRGRMTIGEELGEPYVVGSIYDITENRVLIAEGWDEDDDIGIFVTGNAIWLTIDEETKIMDNEGRFMMFEDLEVGKNVRAWTTGMILESYPAQGTAFVIMIESGDDDEVARDDEVTEEDEDEDENEKEDVDNDDISDNKNDKVDMACYIGGCSGELCTDDPEAMSTCEVLPGMECITMGMRCEAVDGECAWVMSQTAAECFMEVEEEDGVEVRDTRIGYLFEKAEKFLE